MATLVEKVSLAVGRPYFAGAFLITTKEVFTKIGGFDTSRALAEDVDYSLKAGKMGTCGLLKRALMFSSAVNQVWVLVDV